MRAGQFMSLPFLAIYLAHEGLLTSGQIGLVLGISGFVLSVTGLFNGIYVDRSSHKNTLIIALILSAFCYFGFSFSMHFFYGLLLLNAALGWFRSLIEISGMTLLVTHTKSEDLGYAYSARFIAANLGVVLGPLIGALMSVHKSLFIFYLAGGINIIIAFILILYRGKSKPVEVRQPPAKVWQNFREVFKDKVLVNLTLINLILWTAYSQIDSTIPQYLAYNWKNPAIIFSILMVTNAGICVLFQTTVLRFAELSSLKWFGVTGSILFSLSFFILCVSRNSTLLIISVILMSFAELFTLPINGLLVVRVAPKHLIASYNGLSSLGMLGVCIGPMLGGYGLQLFGGRTVFLLAGLLPLLAIWRYIKAIPD